jgi:moderate conductance mechanosensitive channel
VLALFTERGIELANPQRNFVIGVPHDSDVEGHVFGSDERDDEDSRTPPRRKPS